MDANRTESRQPLYAELAHRMARLIDSEAFKPGVHSRARPESGNIS